MKILALDTATEACSAALRIGNKSLERFQLAPREHTRLILPMVQSLLDEAGISIGQLDAIAFGRGPGSFTGVRIATGVAQGLAYGADLPVVPVSTLASIAQCACNDQQGEKVLAAIDARMGGVYWGAYALPEKVSESNEPFDSDTLGAPLMVLQGEEKVSAPAEVSLPDNGSWTGAGSGWKAYAKELSHLGEQVVAQYGDYLPHSATIAQLAQAAFARGEYVEAALAMPVYLRDDVAKKKAEQKKAGR